MTVKNLRIWSELCHCPQVQPIVTSVVDKPKFQSWKYGRMSVNELFKWCFKFKLITSSSFNWRPLTRKKSTTKLIVKIGLLKKTFKIRKNEEQNDWKELGCLPAIFKFHWLIPDYREGFLKKIIRQFACKFCP